MHDRRDDRSDRGRSRHDHHDGHRGGGEHSRRHRREERGRGPDTRFLQLEMSEVLYAEAESVTKQAFRELLLEEAKARFRERFGDQIAGLAQLAVDELMRDVLASLDVEATIRERNREQEARHERLSGILSTENDGAEGDRERRTGGSPEPDGESGSRSDPEADEDR